MGVNIRFKKENIETMSWDGEFMLTVLSYWAQEGSGSVSENIKFNLSVYLHLLILLNY